MFINIIKYNPHLFPTSFPWGYEAFNFLNEQVLTMYMLDVFKRKMKGYMLNECAYILASFAYSEMHDYI